MMDDEFFSHLEIDDRFPFIDPLVNLCLKVDTKKPELSGYIIN